MQVWLQFNAVNDTLCCVVCSVQARYIPGWFFGPEKKLHEIEQRGVYYRNPETTLEDGTIKTWLKPVDDNLVSSRNRQPSA